MILHENNKSKISDKLFPLEVLFLRKPTLEIRLAYVNLASYRLLGMSKQSTGDWLFYEHAKMCKKRGITFLHIRSHFRENKVLTYLIKNLPSIRLEYRIYRVRIWIQTNSRIQCQHQWLRPKSVEPAAKVYASLVGRTSSKFIRTYFRTISHKVYVHIY